jgi:hypothetical protein
MYLHLIDILQEDNQVLIHTQFGFIQLFVVMQLEFKVNTL